MEKTTIKLSYSLDTPEGKKVKNKRFNRINPQADDQAYRSFMEAAEKIIGKPTNGYKIVEKEIY